MSVQLFVIHANGAVDQLWLPTPDASNLCVLQDAVGGYIEAVPLPFSRYLVFAENGKAGIHLVNHTATAIAHEAQSIAVDDYIAGDAIIVPACILQ